MAINWFDQGGAAYAAFRPDYPPELAAFLASMVPGWSLAVDVGCGAGQLTVALARHFEAVIGVDPGADQIAHAATDPGVRYLVAPAEDTGLEGGKADLITAAQAAHWFDLDAFYPEVRRLAAPDAILALITYGTMVLEDDLSARFDRFYVGEIGPFWPPERRLVDSGYADMAFPFEELSAPDFAIRRDWSFAEFLGYLGTWSAVRQARESGREDIANRFAQDLSALWGDPERTRSVAWPIRMRLGRL